MPRRTYNPKAGRRRPVAPNPDALNDLRDHFRRLAARREYAERNPS